MDKQPGGAPNLVALLDISADSRLTEITVFNEVGCQAAVSAAGGGVFGDAEVIGKDARVKVVARFIGFGRKHEDVFGGVGGDKAQKMLGLWCGAAHRVQRAEGNDKKGQSGGHFLRGEASV